MRKSRMQYHIDSWWELRKKKKYVHHIDKLNDDFKRFIEVVEQIQPYSICIPAKTFYEHSNAPYVELAVYSQPLMINRLDSAPEQCFVDVVKLEKVFCEINECKGDIYDGIVI